MNAKEYKKIYEKGEKEGWDKVPISDCRKADVFLKKETLKKAKKAIKEKVKDKNLCKWIFIYLDFGFGSGETDELLMSLKAYPGWVKALK
jgi:hypothetical protein